MPCPIGMVATVSSTTPSGSTFTVTTSDSALPPVHSRKVAMPRPRRRPCAFDATRRASKPFQSASARPWSSIFSNWPTS